MDQDLFQGISSKNSFSWKISVYNNFIILKLYLKCDNKPKHLPDGTAHNPKGT